MYAISQSPYALHSPTLLAELGLNVKVLLEGEGISRKGTKDATPFSGDVIRKMLNDMTPMELIQWYNRHVGRAYLKQANYEPCIHILDCTKHDRKHGVWCRIPFRITIYFRLTFYRNTLGVICL